MNGNLKPCLGSQLQMGHPLTKGLVACWLMNEGSGIYVNDFSSHSHPAIFSNAARVSVWSPTLYGIGLGCTDDIAVVDNSSQLKEETDYSIVARYLINEREAYHAIYSTITGYNGGVPNSSGIALHHSYNASPARVAFTVAKSNSVYVRAGYSIGSIPLNTWNTVVGTWQKDIFTANIYVNGTLRNSDTNINIDTYAGNVCNLLNFSPAYYGGLYGYCAYIYVYNRALSAGEIAKLYLDPFCMFEEDM